jgi:hypothetical protein
MVRAIAAAPLVTGSYVALTDWKADRLPHGNIDVGAKPDPRLKGPGGIVNCPPGSSRTEEIAAGTPCVVRTDGGALARITHDVTIDIRGTKVRLAAGDQKYLRLRNGRVIGFDGDDQIAR